MSAATALARRGRVLAGARGAYGLLLVVAPGRSPEVGLAGDLDPLVPPVVRALGARHLVQSAVTGVDPSGTVLRWGAGVDVLHAASMVALAAVSPRHRRPALVSAASATGFAVAGLLATRTSRPG